MQKLFASIVFFTLASLGAPALAGDADDTKADPDLAEARELNRQLDQALPRAARWLLEHTDPRKRAAGLLFQVNAGQRIAAQAAFAERMAEDDRFRDHDWIHQVALDGLKRAEARDANLQEFEPAVLLDRFEKAIRTTTDGAALAWLATACATADIEAFCVDTGLDDAIVRHDGANLFSRGALLDEPTSERIEALILDSHQTRTYLMTLVNTWFEALAAVDNGSRLDDHDRLSGAYTVALAYAIPAYGPLAQACGAEVAPVSELELACERVLDDMAERGETALAQLMPSAIRAERAKARGEDRRAAEFEAEKQRIHDRASCATSEIEALLEDDNGSNVRNYLALLLEHGEIEGRNRFAESHGIECSG